MPHSVLRKEQILLFQIYGIYLSSRCQLIELIWHCHRQTLVLLLELLLQISFLSLGWILSDVVWMILISTHIRSSTLTMSPSTPSALTLHWPGSVCSNLPTYRVTMCHTDSLRLPSLLLSDHAGNWQANITHVQHTHLLVVKPLFAVGHTWCWNDLSRGVMSLTISYTQFARILYQIVSLLAMPKSGMSNIGPM